MRSASFPTLARSAALAAATTGLALAAIASLASLGGCRSKPANDGAPTLALHTCRPKGANEDVRCGTLDVAEDRASGQGRRIALNVAVVSALSASAAPDPVFILAGGPGQSAVDVLGALLPRLERVHRRHDLVFVDQRGTGASSPLKCSPVEDAGLQEKLGDEVDKAGLHKCLDGYKDAGIDVSRFTTTIAMDDLDDVRAALGYDKIDLYGVSYGTRAALSYLRQHPDHARSAVLDGVDPPSMSLILTASEDAERAFNRIFDACAADAACSQSFPDLRAKFAALLASLEAHPASTAVADPITGAVTPITLTRASFVANLHGLLYNAEISALLPLLIDRASHGDFAPFVAQAVATSAIGEGLSQGMFFSVVCAEDAPLATMDELERRTKGTYFGDSFGKSLLDICSFWPKGTVASAYHQPVASPAPVLLLSGDLDPITPPSHAEEARVQLSGSVALTVPGTGHNTGEVGCVPRLVAQFVDQGSGANLPTECVSGLRRPPFFVTFAGPEP